MTKSKRNLLLILVLLFNGCLFGQDSEHAIIQEISNYRAGNNLSKVAESLNKLAFLYWESGKLEKALESFEQSVTINIDIKNNNAVKVIYSNMGLIYTDLGQPETALVFFRKSLLLSHSQKNNQDIGTNLINIATALNSLSRNAEALENLKEALVVVKVLNNKNLLRTCYGSLAETYQALGESQKSMEYFSLYTAFQKELQQEEIERQKKLAEEKIALIEQKAQKAIEEKKVTEEKLIVTQGSLKKAEEINQINQLQIENQRIEINNQRLLKLIFIIAMFFVLIVALFILRNNQQKKKHNAILEKINEEIKAKNHKINQSINYAKNIQGALLPDITQFEKIYPESFIFFSPRDVVSGDFYWFHQVSKSGNKFNIIAAVDCTGHGVPGAFMSMLGMSFLEEIVHDKGILNPDEILENMHKMVKLALRQDSSGNTDGMDIVICVHDELRKVIKFAGAVNPLLYVQNGQLNLLKGDYFGIGGQMKEAQGSERMFTMQTLDVSIPTTCYMFSDGFADQFGGEKGGKYFMKNFRELLFSIHEQPMAEQSKILENKLTEWLGNTYQRLDDVLIMGFRL